MINPVVGTKVVAYDKNYPTILEEGTVVALYFDQEYGEYYAYVEADNSNLNDVYDPGMDRPYWLFIECDSDRIFEKAVCKKG